MEDLAEETAKTKRTREKLQKRLADIEKCVTKQALERKSKEISRWISTHANSRVVLKSKSISLFDENQNSVEISKTVVKLSTLLKKHD